jgi:hypothetical protein
VTGWEYWHKKGADGVDLQRVAFVAVAAGKAEAALITEAAINGCPLDAPGAVRLLDFEQVDYNRREGFNATFAHSRLVALIPNYGGRGRYALYYVNCEVGSAVTSFGVRASLYSVLPGVGRPGGSSPGGGGGRPPSSQRRAYLAAGEAGLPRLYAGYAGAYCVLAGLWVLACARRAAVGGGGGRGGAGVHGGHALIALLLGVKAASLACSSAAYKAVSEAGSAPAGLALGDLANAARGAAPLLAVGAAGCGWGPLRRAPLLQHARAARLAALALPLQALGEVALAYLARAGPGGAGASTASGALAAWPGAGTGTGRGAALAAWATSSWGGGTTRRALHAFSLAGAALVLAPAFWAARAGGAGRPGPAAPQPQDAVKAGRSAAGAALFRRCYLTAAAYAAVSRAGAATLARRSPARQAWLPLAAVEAAGLAFYLATAIAFAPGAGDAYRPFAAASAVAAPTGRASGGGGVHHHPASPAAATGGAYSRPGGAMDATELAPLRARGGGGAD